MFKIFRMDCLNAMPTRTGVKFKEERGFSSLTNVKYQWKQWQDFIMYKVKKKERSEFNNGFTAVESIDVLQQKGPGLQTGQGCACVGSFQVLRKEKYLFDRGKSLPFPVKNSWFSFSALHILSFKPQKHIFLHSPWDPDLKVHQNYVHFLSPWSGVLYALDVPP